MSDSLEVEVEFIAGLKNELVATQAMYQRLLADMTRCADRLRNVMVNTSNSQVSRMARLEHDHMSVLIKHHVQSSQ